MATSVKVIIRKDKISKKENLAPLFLRIIKDRKTKFIYLGVKVDPKYWDEEKMKVKKGATNYSEINNFILQKRAEAEKTSLELENTSSYTSPSKIKEKIVGKKPKNFFDYAYPKLRQMKNSISPSTYMSYVQYLGKFEKYIGSTNLLFNEIDINMVKDYENHLYEKQKNSPSTVEYSFRVIKIILNHAINEGIIDSSLYPFKNYRFKVPKPVKNYLSNEQFEAVLNYKNRPSYDSDIYYDMFVFACFAGGLRFFDVLEMKWFNFIEEEQRLVKVIRKTKRKHQFKLPQKAVDILMKYKKEESKNDHYIFPVLKNDFDYKIAPEIIYLEKENFNKRANITIRRMGKDLGLPFNLTFHTSRHTFATRALTKGMRIEHVSKILDHTNISITQIYAKIVNEELDKAMEIMDE